MIPTFRPLMALLFVAGGTLAHAADSTANTVFTAESAGIDVFSVSADTVATSATPPVQTGAARDLIRAGGWSVGISSARADHTLIDNGLVGIQRDLGHAMSVTVHAGDGRVAGSGFDWRDLKAGLNRKLEGGWLLALNYTRAYGAAGSYDRMAAVGGRAEDRPAFLSAGRRALVLSAARRF